MLRGLEKLDAAFEHVYFIPGNHDLYHRSRRDVSSVEWAKHLKNTTIIDDFYSSGGVTIAPWLIGDDWKKIKGMGGEYLFGHFELPHFWMNAMVEMPDHGELQTEHLGGYSSVFSGHFHKRQTRGNVTYIGNAFPHNYADAGDDDRGMMTIEWGGVHQYHRWPGQPVYRVYKLSQVLEDPDRLLLPDSNVRVNLDIEISYEESAFIREQLMPKYRLRDMTLIPVKLDLGEDNTDYTGLQFESVDSIIINQIEQLQQGSFDRGLLLEIYKNL
jgi:hypothetical protein